MVMEEQQTDMELDSERVPVPQVQKLAKTAPQKAPQKLKGIGRGKPRFRKKMLHAAIVKQMEFYFGDANLSRDRFLAKLIKEDPYVGLSVFVSFNKIRELTTDVHRIAKALQTSTMLSVSDDGTKVCRLTPFIQRENVEECSVYVQNLPPDTDHEWLASIFSQYGPIAYISIPKYKSNKKIKGFAFVEFESPKSAVECLKAYKKKGCLLPSSTSPNKLLSITTYEPDKDSLSVCSTERKVSEEMEHQKQDEHTNVKEDHKNSMEIEKGMPNDNEHADIQASAVNNQDKGTLRQVAAKTSGEVFKRAKKRKHKDSEHNEVAEITSPSVNDDLEDGPKRSKKMKDHTSEGHSHFPSHHDENVIADERRKCEITKKEGCEMTEEEMLVETTTNNRDPGVDALEEENSAAQETEKKKRKKRKKRSKIEEDSGVMGLQVMSKKDWKHLRNKYLELQRSKMKQLKQHLRKTRWNQWSAADKNKHDYSETKEEKGKLGGKEESNSVSFVPGVIVRIEMVEQCTDPKKFKAELKGNNSIKYVDVSNGSYEAYIRCDNADSAQLLAQKSNEERRMSVLQGEEEQLYWEKILKDRKEKLGNKNRPKQRGRDKLLKKAEKELGKHIKFDEV